MAGPGIMVTVMSMIASVVMNSVLTPLFSEFNSTVLQNDLDTLMAPLGGTQNGSLTLLNDVAALTSISSQPGVVSQDSGSGYVAQSTGSSVGATVIINPISSVGTSSSFSSCDITAIGTCMAGQFNTLLLMGQTAGGITFILEYFLHQSSLSANTKTFMWLYIGQRVAKVLLYILKLSGSTSNSVIDFEGVLYVISAGLNLYQMTKG